MEEMKLSKLLSINATILNVIKDWVDRDIEIFISNGVISDVNDIPKKREELFEKYIDLFYSLL